MLDMPQHGQQATLTVRWFSPERGYGFASHPDAPERDVMIHANILNNRGFPPPADGALITGLVEEDDRGAKFSDITNVRPPEVSGPALPALIGVDIESLPLRPARLKWFDQVRGFGFVQVFGAPGDVFLHIEVLRASGLSAPASGEAVAVKVTEGERGMLAAEVKPWDAALPSERSN